MERQDWTFILAIVGLIIAGLLCYAGKITESNFMQIFMLIIGTLIGGVVGYVLGIRHKT